MGSCSRPSPTFTVVVAKAFDAVNHSRTRSALTILATATLVILACLFDADNSCENVRSKGGFLLSLGMFGDCVLRERSIVHSNSVPITVAHHLMLSVLKGHVCGWAIQ